MTQGIENAVDEVCAVMSNEASAELKRALGIAPDPTPIPKVSLGLLNVIDVRAKMERSHSKYNRSSFVLSVQMRCRDVYDSDKVNVVHVQDSVPVEMASSREYVGALIHRMAMKAFAHEIDEWLTIDGERVFEPHPEEHTGFPSGEVTRFRPTPQQARSGLQTCPMTAAANEHGARAGSEVQATRSRRPTD